MSLSDTAQLHGDFFHVQSPVMSYAQSAACSALIHMVNAAANLNNLNIATQACKVCVWGVTARNCNQFCMLHSFVCDLT